MYSMLALYKEMREINSRKMSILPQLIYKFKMGSPKETKKLLLRAKKNLKKKTKEGGSSNQILKRIVKVWSLKILFAWGHKWTDR